MRWVRRPRTRTVTCSSWVQSSGPVARTPRDGPSLAATTEHRSALANAGEAAYLACVSIRTD